MGRAKIIKNFASRLADFDQRADTATPALVLPFPTGRAYKRKDGLPCFDEVFFKPIGEDVVRHRRQQEVIAENKAIRNGVYIGTAGIANYGYMAHSRASAAILFDINPLQRLLHEEMIKIFAANPTLEGAQKELLELPQRFIKRVESSLTKEQVEKLKGVGVLKNPRVNPSYVVSYRDPEIFSEELASFIGMPREDRTDRRHPIMGLDDRKTYAHLHALAKNNAIACVTLDIKDTKGWQVITKHIKANGAEVSLAYVSNIFYFMRGQEVDFAHTPLLKGSLEKAWRNVNRLAPLYTLYGHGRAHTLKMSDEGIVPRVSVLVCQGIHF
ncbi:MAG: hypothetical protein GC136_03365 [Alphaproteobacteria bacterium]|nr:hypothetical protein [Alphaproteobacteria bacterium]